MPNVHHRLLPVRHGGVSLEGLLTLPAEPIGLIVLAHGTGSGRASPRNRLVALALENGGFATLRFDLLTDVEESNPAHRFHVTLLWHRVVAAVLAARALPELAGLPLGLFGSSTGAAAALVASTQPGVHAEAIATRGGRPDLAGSALGSVRTPVLFVVGERDRAVLTLHRGVLDQLGGPRRLAIVPGAGHLFEEPGTLEAVADLTLGWFARHVGARAPLTHAH